MSKPLRLAFAGTPQFAAVSLRALIEDRGHDIVTVYTRPDRPAGRGRKLTAGAVKQLALAHGLPVRQPQSLREAGVLQALRDLHLDVLIVVAYGLILPQAVLEAPRLGCINVHASLLPRWRGAAPIERAVLAGDGETGITLMQVEPALDSGPILAQRRCRILSGDTAGTLHDRLAKLGAAELIEVLPRLAAGEIVPVPQDSAHATYAQKIDKTEAVIDWRLAAMVLERRVRAFNPRPGASAALAGEAVKIWEATALPVAAARAPGEVVRACAHGIDVATGDGALRLQTLQTPGKRAVSAADYLNAHPELAVTAETPAP